MYRFNTLFRSVYGFKISFNSIIRDLTIFVPKKNLNSLKLII